MNTTYFAKSSKQLKKETKKAVKKITAKPRKKKKAVVVKKVVCSKSRMEFEGKIVGPDVPTSVVLKPPFRF